MSRAVTDSAPDSESLSHQVQDLSAVYWRYVPDEELVERSAAEREHAVASHVALAQERSPGQLLLNIGVSHSRDEQPPRHSVIEIVADDTPFLVDSTTAELTRLGIGISVFVHPQVVVRRDPLGKLLSVRDIDTEATQEGELVESWMHIEIDRQDDPAMLVSIQNNLRRVLTDVRESVEDWAKMRSKALGIADELAQAELAVPDKDVNDARGLLRWLAEDHFTFLGYREYDLVRDENGEYLRAVMGSGLGILRGDQIKPRRIDQMVPEVRQRILEQRLLIITKANSRSTVHRPAYLDYIGLKTFDADGNVIGERRFLGLFSSTAYLESVRNLPVISRKVEEVISRAGLSLRSHSGKELLQILETYPRDELFQIRTEELYETVMSVLRLAGKRQLRLFVRRDAYGRFVSCLVYLPRDRYTTQTRNRMQQVLSSALNGVGIDYTARVTEGMLARVRFVVRTDPTASVPDVDVPALQAKLVEITRLWEEDFAEALRGELGGDTARSLIQRYQYAFSAAYQAERSPMAAVDDVARLETLDDANEISVHLEQAPADRAGEKGGETMQFTVYRCGEAMSLSAVLPVLQSLGVQVIDERPYQVAPTGAPAAWIYDFGLTAPEGIDDRALADEKIRLAVENAFVACWRGESEVDGFNQLVLRAGLTWDQIVVLRAYAKYLRQAGSIYGMRLPSGHFDGTS